MKSLVHATLISFTLASLATLSGCGGGGGGSNPPPAITAPVPTLTFALKQLEFSWPAISAADHYRILVNPDGASGFTVHPDAASIAGTSHTLTIPVHNINWASALYRVEACNASESTCVGSNSQALTLIDSIAAIGYVKASNSDAGDWFAGIALSGDGNTLAVGAPGEDSAANGIGGNDADNTAPEAGAVYVYVKSGATWLLQAYIKAHNTDAGDWFGLSVALSSDGNILAVGAPGEDSDGSSSFDNSADGIGAVYVYSRIGSSWDIEAYGKGSYVESGDGFGDRVALSGDGNTLAVSTLYDDSAAKGIDGNGADNSAAESGAVYVFHWSSSWIEQAYIKASNTGAGDYFGESIALSGDGNALAVAAPFESSAATGVGGDETDNTAARAGAAYVYLRSGSVWSQEAYIKASNTDSWDWFGFSMDLSADGNTLALGAIGESSAATGIGGNETDNSESFGGATYVYLKTGSTWAQQAYVKASNTELGDALGTSVALSADGNMMIVGADGESSAAKGVGGDDLDNAAGGSGAVFVYLRSGSTWSQQSYVKASNTNTGDFFGFSVDLSDDGNTMAVGADSESSSATGVGGNQGDNSATEAGAVYLF